MTEAAEQRSVIALNRRVDAEASLAHGDFRNLLARFTHKYDQSPMDEEEAADLVDGSVAALLRLQDAGADEPLPPLPERAAEIFSAIELAPDAHGVRKFDAATTILITAWRRPWDNRKWPV